MKLTLIETPEELSQALINIIKITINDISWEEIIQAFEAMIEYARKQSKEEEKIERLRQQRIYERKRR